MGKRKERKRKKKGTFPLGITDIGRGCLGREKRMNAAFFYCSLFADFWFQMVLGVFSVLC